MDVPLVYSPGLLMQGPISTIIVNTLTALVGVVGLAMAIQGWAFERLTLPARLLVGGFSLLSIDPNPGTDIVGVCGLAIMIGWQYINKKITQKKLAHQGDKI